MSIKCSEEVVALRECAVRAAGGLLTCVCVQEWPEHKAQGSSSSTRTEIDAVCQMALIVNGSCRGEKINLAIN